MLSNTRITVVVLLVAVLLAVPVARAKDLGPGDLRVCGRNHCVTITSPTVLRILSSHYWGASTAPVASRVSMGAPAFELRFADGSVSGIVATARLDHFRAHGFACGRFERGRWYRFPARAVTELERLTVGLTPLRVTSPPRSC
jgi:hypothetical protein